MVKPPVNEWDDYADIASCVQDRSTIFDHYIIFINRILEMSALQLVNNIYHVCFQICPAPLKTNISPDNWWLEDEPSFQNATISGALFVKTSGGVPRTCQIFLGVPSWKFGFKCQHFSMQEMHAGDETPWWWAGWLWHLSRGFHHRNS